MPSVVVSAWGLAALVAGIFLISAFSQPSNQAGSRLPEPPVVESDKAGREFSDDLLAAVGPGRARRISGVFDQFEHCCLPAGEQRYDTSERATLSRLNAVLEISDLGRGLLRQAERHGILLCVDPSTALNGYYRSQMRLLAVNAGLSDAHMIVFLAHELGHVPQHPRYSNNRTFAPEDLILLRRTREAAAEAVATRILWQLRRNGYGQAWRQKLATRYGDIPRAFQSAWEALPEDPERALEATRAAFDQWFAAPWRLNFYDRETVRHLERISRDHLGLVPTRRALSHAFLTQIAWHGGKNYLTGSGAPPLTGAYYRGGLSSGNQGRLAEILRRARRQPLSLGRIPG